MVLDVNWFYGSVAWRPKNVPRRDFRLNDVSWSSVATSLLDNSGYQTDREIYDHAAAISLFAWRFRRSHERCKTDRYINLAFGRGHFALSLCEELFNIFARVIMNASQWLHTLHLSHNGSKKTKLISQRRLNQIGDKGARG